MFDNMSRQIFKIYIRFRRGICMINEIINETTQPTFLLFNNDNFYYLPDFLKEFKEFKKLRNLSESDIKELLKLWNSFKDILDDNFINDSTENGVESWERVLNITPKAYDTLNDRKFRVLTRLNEKLPIHREVERRLA